MYSTRNGCLCLVRRLGAAARGVQTNKSSTSEGFTLIELLVVIAIVAILAAIQLPALARGKIKTQSTACMLNLEQLTLGWTMYAADSDGRLVPNGNGGNWVPNSYLDWGTSAANTDSNALVGPNALLGPYVRNPRLYKCPADTGQAQNGARVRSYSLSADLGGVPTDVGKDPQGRIFTFNGRGATRETDLRKPGPANVFTFLDEHGDSIDDGVFQLNPGQNTTGGSVYFRNMPANYHNGAYSVSFADGHSQEVRLQQRSDTSTASSSLLPVVPSNAYLFSNNYNGSPKFSGGHYVLTSSPDYNTLDNEEPYQ